MVFFMALRLMLRCRMLILCYYFLSLIIEWE